MMRSDDLTKARARALKNKLAPMLGYLTRLKRRMVRRGFPLDDRLLAVVTTTPGHLRIISCVVTQLRPRGAFRPIRSRTSWHRLSSFACDHIQILPPVVVSLSRVCNELMEGS